MKRSLPGPHKPRFRDSVNAVVQPTGVEISMGKRQCSFQFSANERSAVVRLLADLEVGGLTIDDLVLRSPELAEHIPPLLADFDRLRLLVESAPISEEVLTGTQLYREVRRLSDRVFARLAKSTFYNALVEDRATREQLIGYALEYYWIVHAAPGLIAPALATASSDSERAIIQSYLQSELGHDRFLQAALATVGLQATELEQHQPLTTTFSLCASLGVYARQHPLSFKAGLFLFERAQPAFVEAFDDRCKALELPEKFYLPLRQHADLNTNYHHEDISRSLMQLEGAIDAETFTVVKRHVSLLAETMVQQEEQILEYYGQTLNQIARVFN